MYFPLFVDISEKKILVVGAGKIAARRIAALQMFTEQIFVVAPDVCPAIDKLEKEEKVILSRREFRESDLEEKEIVLAATDNPEVNFHIWKACKKRGILVNVSDRKELCDFYFPSIVKKEEMVIGINSSGTSPGKVKEIRKKIEKL